MRIFSLLKPDLKQFRWQIYAGIDMKNLWITACMDLQCRGQIPGTSMIEPTESESKVHS